MLCLTRRRDERVIVNGNIIVTLVEIKGDKVVLGFDADPSIPVHREEVHLAILRDEEERRLREGGAA